MGNVPGRIPKAQVYDDRPAVARGSYGFEEEAEAAADDAEPPPDAGAAIYCTIKSLIPG